jgi:hypothetical protein
VRRAGLWRKIAVDPARAGCGLAPHVLPTEFESLEVSEVRVTRSEFRERVVEVMGKRQLWFELERDRPATEPEVAAVEGVHGVRLSQQYREFLMTYGGGPFAFLTVLGSSPGTRHVSRRRGGNDRCSWRTR